MEAYIQAASQVKEDILNEYLRTFPDTADNDPASIKGEASRVLDNIEIVFRNSAKNRLFTERIRKLPRTRLEKDELIYAYITTDNDDSYHDSINAINCCKKISYFLFSSRYNNFGIFERNKYQNLLRKQERLCPEKHIEIYNTKKAIVEVMTSGPATYASVEPLVTHYLKALHDLLVGQMIIYRIEFDLNKQLSSYLNDILNPLSKYSKSANEQSTKKALITVFSALKQRGLDISDNQKNLQTASIELTNEELISFLALLKSEIRNLRLVCSFTGILNKYIEPAKQDSDRENEKKDYNNKEEKKYLASLKESLSQTFQEWLGKQ